MTHVATIPVTYTVKGIPFGKKAYKEDLYAEFREVSVYEVDTADAPVAVSWRVPGIPQHDVRFDYLTHFEVGTCDDDGRNHTVFHQGRHWLRLLTSHLRGGRSSRGRWGDGTPLLVEDFLGQAVDGKFNALFGFDQFYGRPPLATSGEDVTPRYLTVRENSRDRTMRSLDRLSLISVDGVLHMACNQPMIALPSADYGMARHVFPYVTARYRSLWDNPHADDTRFLPFSMVDELQRHTDAMPEYFVQTDHDMIVHHGPSFSNDAEIEVAADYNVALVYTATSRARKKSYPDLAGYFRLHDLEAKAGFLEDARSQWADDKGGVSPALLDQALALLDERSIGMTLGTAADLIPIAR